MTKAEMEASKRRQGYPVKKQKGKKFRPEHDHTYLEDEIIRLENENKDLKEKLEEKNQLCTELNEAYHSEKAMNELKEKELDTVKKKIRTARAMAVIGVIMGLIGLVLRLL